VGINSGKGNNLNEEARGQKQLEGRMQKDNQKKNSGKVVRGS